jgi:hypothetical protein
MNKYLFVEPFLIFLFISEGFGQQSLNLRPIRETGQISFVVGDRNILWPSFGAMLTTSNSTSLELSIAPLFPVLYTAVGGSFNYYLFSGDSLTPMISLQYFANYTSSFMGESNLRMSSQDITVSIGIDACVSDARYYLRLGTIERRFFDPEEKRSSFSFEFGAVYKLF